MNTKYLKNIKLYIAVFFVAMVTGSCIDDNFDFDKLSTHVENEGEWKVPGLINTTFKIQDILNQIDSTGFVTSEPDGLVLIVYTDTAYTAVAQDVVTFPDQMYDTLFIKQDFDLAGGFSDGSVTMQKSDVNFLFTTFGSQVIDSILLISANMNVNISSSFKYEGTVTLTFPELKKGGVPYQKIININDNSGAFTFNNVYNDLDGYTLDFTNASSINTFFVTYRLQLIESTGDGTVDNNDDCNIVINFTDIKYDYVWGHVGQQIINISERVVDLDFFSAFKEGQFDLRNPRIKVKVNNSFGLQVGVFMEKLQLRVGDDNLWVDIAGDDVPSNDNPWLIAKPVDIYPNTPLAASSMMEITGLRSNLGELVSRLPDRIKYEEKVVLNPAGDITEFNFLDDNSRVQAILNFEIPLWGRTSGITYSDTLDMDLSDVAKEKHRIDYLDLILTIGNGLPHNLGFKAYLMDSLYNIVDSLPNANDGVTFDGNQWWIVESGIMGADSVINQQTGKTVSEHVIRLEGEGVDVIDNVKYMSVDFKYVTSDGNSETPPFVKYFDFYEMDFHASMKVKFNISENL